MANVPAENAITFLENFEEKEAFTEENKAIAAGLRAIYYIGRDDDKATELYHRLEKFIQEHKDSDSFTFSTFYKFALTYFQSKNKQRQFYENSLQYLIYTPAEEI